MTAPATSTPLVSPSTNPLRKQTLLGIAPTVASPTREAPSTQGASEPGDFTPAPEAPPSQAGAPLVAPVKNPLRSQTLLGVAPASPPEGPEAACVVSPAPTAARSGMSPVASTKAAQSDAAPQGPPERASPRELASDADATSSRSNAPISRDIASAPSERSSSAAPVATSADDALPTLPRSRARWLAPLGLAAALALGFVGWRSLDRAPATPAVADRALPATDNPTPASGPEKASAEAATAPAPVPTPSAAPASSGAAVEALPIAAGSAEAPSAAPEASGAAPAATKPGGKVRIQVDSAPTGARMFWKGKEVGTTPFVLELDPGERHAYELGLPGHVTRKVVIDGTRTEVKIGLRPAPKARPGVTSRRY